MKTKNLSNIRILIEEEEDLLLFAALRRTKYNQKYKLKKQHDRIHIASSIDTSIADCSA